MNNDSSNWFTSVLEFCCEFRVSISCCIRVRNELKISLYVCFFVSEKVELLFICVWRVVTFLENFSNPVIFSSDVLN